MVPASVSSRSKCPEAGGVWQVQGAERRTMTGAEAVGEEVGGGGVRPAAVWAPQGTLDFILRTIRSP